MTEHIDPAKEKAAVDAELINPRHRVAPSKLAARRLCYWHMRVAMYHYGQINPDMLPADFISAWKEAGTSLHNLQHKLDYADDDQEAPQGL